MEYEIYHHGTKGMRWGIRRYQNKDGSLTNAGRKRYAKLEAEMKQLKPKKISKAEKAAEVEKAARKKTVSEMTDDELRERTNRMRMEKEYYDAERGLLQVNPVKVSKSKKFINSLLNDVVAPAAKNVGKEWAEKFMKDKLGLNKKDADPLKKLENEYKKLEWEQKIDRIKKKDPDDDLSWDERQKKQTWLKGRVEELENEKKVKYYQRTGKVMDSDKNSSNNNSGNNNSNTSNNSGNKPNDNPSNNPNKQNIPNSDAGNKTENQTSQPTQNTSKTSQPKTVTQTTKVDDLDYYSKEYEKRVDDMLAEIDSNGWEMFEKYYR